MTGTVVALQRYPVKSLLGERLTSAEITARGVTGDREAALIDAETGKIASAKQPRLWRGLLTLSYADASDDELLSRRLGRRVQLVEQPPAGATLDRARPDEVLAQGINAVVAHDVSTLAQGSFFDFAPLHLITTATLRLLGGQDFLRYRPNMVIETEDLEYSWVGRDVHIGHAAVRVIVPTPRCAVPTLAHGDLPADPDALRIPAKLNRHNVFDLGALPCAGVYAEVISPGQVRVGDRVRL